jgi:hypothetical protein
MGLSFLVQSYDCAMKLLRYEKVLTPRHRHSAMEQRFDADFQIVDRQNVKKMNERYLR